MKNAFKQIGYTSIVTFLLLVMVLSSSVVPVYGQISSASTIRDQIAEINTSVNDKKVQMKSLNRKIGQYKGAIEEKKVEKAEVQDQINLLDSNIARTQLSIDITKGEIEGLELEIESLDGKIVTKENQMARERILMGSIARKLYRTQFKKSTFEILLSHDSFSEFFDTVRAISDMQTGVHRALVSIQNVHLQLSEERTGREQKQIALTSKQGELMEEREKLEHDRNFKDVVLEETESSELRYRYLLADLKTEHAQADSEIAYLEKVLRDKIDTADRLGTGETVLSWPVVPTRGISAKFHDVEYPFRHVFEHAGIDIRAYQSTPIRAPSSGIVARAKDNGYGYSYIMLLHNNNISTVFGHVSQLVAKEDTFVQRGEIIGYSGGMPGTLGAGRLTTGPHLHFEVRLNGLPVDPERYLEAR